MLQVILRHYIIYVVTVILIFQWGGCSTSEVVPTLPPDPPNYTQVPHPAGQDLGDISAIFIDEGAPKLPEFARSCDSVFKKLMGITQSNDEQRRGIRELVRSNPVHYHWCFYGKL